MSYTASGLWVPSKADFIDGPAGATLTDTRGGINITHAGNSSVQHLYGMYKVAPAAPYTLTAKISYNGASSTQAGSSLFGLFLSDEAGLYQTISHAPNNGGAGFLQTFVINYSSATALASVPKSGGNIPWICQDLWLRINDDNANRTYLYSRDGVNFLTFYQVVRTSYLTPTRIGFQVDSYDAATNATLEHWRIQ